jgi:hypothetical protein
MSWAGGLAATMQAACRMGCIRKQRHADGGVLRLPRPGRELHMHANHCDLLYVARLFVIAGAAP